VKNHSPSIQNENINSEHLEHHSDEEEESKEGIFQYVRIYSGKKLKIKQKFKMLRFTKRLKITKKLFLVRS
jgi:hypothetical protein